MSDLLDIADVTAQTALAQSALRFYEREGLIRSDGRNGLRRQYRPAVIERLAVIVLCRAAGFSLSEIKSLLATKGRSPAWKQLAARKHAEIDARIAQLTVVSTQLAPALSCPSPNVMTCEHFRASTQQVFEHLVRPPSTPQ